MERLKFLLVEPRDVRMLATAKALVAVGEPEIAISDFSFFTKRSNAAELMLAGFSRRLWLFQSC